MVSKGRPLPGFGPLSWQLFEYLVVLLPLGFILSVGLVMHSAQRAPSDQLDVVVTAVALAASLFFSGIVLHTFGSAQHELTRLYERSRGQAQQLMALHQAGVAMTETLDQEAVLRRVVDLSRQVVGARYAALSTVGEDGTLDQFLSSGLTEAEIAAIGQLPSGRGVLHLMAEQTAPVRLKDLTTHPRAIGFPPHHPPMRSFLGVPILFRERRLGTLYLTEKEHGAEFTEEDEQTIERFVVQAAATIANARLLHEVRRLSAIAERERIGRDLHDGTIQRLYALGLGLQVALTPDSTPQDQRAALQRTLEQVQEIIADIRHYVFDAPIDALPLASAIGQLTEELTLEQGPRFRLKLGALSSLHLDHGTNEELVHVVREGLANAVRHAEASEVAITAVLSEHSLQLSIEDNGRGLPPGLVIRQGHGLDNVRHRLKALGGALELKSQQGRGTRLVMTIPIAAGAKEERA